MQGVCRRGHRPTLLAPDNEPLVSQAPHPAGDRSAAIAAPASRCAMAVRHGAAGVHWPQPQPSAEPASASRTVALSSDGTGEGSCTGRGASGPTACACHAPRPTAAPARGCSSGCSSPGFRWCRVSSYAQVRTVPDAPERQSSGLLICGFGVRVPGGAPILTWHFTISLAWSDAVPGHVCSTFARQSGPSRPGRPARPVRPLPMVIHSVTSGEGAGSGLAAGAAPRRRPASPRTWLSDDSVTKADLVEAAVACAPAWWG
jgi:hypothetical protein